MHRSALLIPLLALALPMAAAAEEFVYGLQGTATYDDNVFFDAEGETDDLLLRLGPRLELRDRSGDFQWSLAYRPEYEWYLDTDDIDGWNHDAEGDLTWKVDPRTTIKASNRFRSLNQVGSATEIESTADGDFETTVRNRDRLDQNRFFFSLDHQLRPRHALASRIEFNTNSYDDPGRRDSDVLSVTLNYAYLLTPRDRLGGGLRFTRQSFDSIENFDSSDTLFYNLFGSWTHQFDPTLTLNVAAGPTLIDSDEQDVPSSFDLVRFPTVPEGGQQELILIGSCTRFPDDACQGNGAVPLTSTGEISGSLVSGAPSIDDTELTYFARISLQKRWDTVSGELAYTRDANTTSGIGTSTVSDFVLASLDWTPSPKFRARFEASWLKRESATESLFFFSSLAPGVFGVIPAAEATGAVVAEAFDSGVDRERFGVNLLLTYRWNERVRLHWKSFWSTEDFEGDVTRDRDVERLRSVVGIQYQFRPVQL